jgi:hypothetical protein
VEETKELEKYVGDQPAAVAVLDPWMSSAMG